MRSITSLTSLTSIWSGDGGTWKMESGHPYNVDSFWIQLPNRPGEILFLKDIPDLIRVLKLHLEFHDRME